MKRLNSYFMTGMMALAMLSSCNNEDNPAGEYQPEGRDAIATFKLVVGSTGTATRAEEAGRDEGTLAEQTVNSLTLLVFDNRSGADVNTFDSEAVLESVVTFDDMGDKGTYTAKVETTEGKKIAIALANNPATGENALAFAKGTTKYGEFMGQVFNATQMNEDNSVSLNIVSKDNGLQMVSPVKGIEVEAGGANAVTLALERLAAKVQVLFPTDIAKADDFEPLALKDMNLKVSNVRYLPTQYQTKMTVATPQVGTGVKNGAVTQHKQFPGLTWNEGEKQWTWTEEQATAWATPGEDTNWSKAPDNAVYVTENIMTSANNPKRNEATALVVKTVLSFDGVTEGSDFYAVCKFKDAEAAKTEPMKWQNLDMTAPYYGVYPTGVAAQQAIDDNSLDESVYKVVQFKGGISYYRINLQNKTEATTGGYFSVKRNSYYQIKVNQINNIGWPYPNDLVDPSDSEEAEDNRVGIDATVNVQAWKVIEQDSSLQ